MRWLADQLPSASLTTESFSSSCTASSKFPGKERFYAGVAGLLGWGGEGQQGYEAKERFHESPICPPEAADTAFAFERPLRAAAASG